MSKTYIYGGCRGCNDCQVFRLLSTDLPNFCKCSCEKEVHVLRGYFVSGTNEYKMFDDAPSGNKRQFIDNSSNSSNESAGGASNRKLTPEEATVEDRRTNLRQCFPQLGNSDNSSRGRGTQQPMLSYQQQPIGGFSVPRRAGGNSHSKLKSAAKPPALEIKKKPLRLFFLPRGEAVPSSEIMKELLADVGQYYADFPYLNVVDPNVCITISEFRTKIYQCAILELFQECSYNFEFFHQLGSKRTLYPTGHSSYNFPNVLQWKAYAEDSNKCPSSKAYNLVIVPAILSGEDDEAVGQQSSVSASAVKERPSKGFILDVARSLWLPSSSSSSSSSTAGTPTIRKTPVLLLTDREEVIDVDATAGDVVETIDVDATAGGVAEVTDVDAATGYNVTQLSLPVAEVFTGVNNVSENHEKQPFNGSLQYLRSLELDILQGSGDDSFDNCSICSDPLGPYKLVYQLPCCRNSFHVQCISQWLMWHGVFCPLCKGSLILLD